MKLLLFDLADAGKALTKGNAFTISTNEIFPVGLETTSGEQQFMLKVEQEESDYTKVANFTIVGADNAPIVQVSPKYSATAIKGWTAVWCGAEATALAWAEDNLLDYEYITNGTNAFVCGTLNQTLTDAYNPLEYPQNTPLSSIKVFKEPYTAI